MLDDNHLASVHHEGIAASSPWSFSVWAGHYANVLILNRANRLAILGQNSVLAGHRLDATSRQGLPFGSLLHNRSTDFALAFSQWRRARSVRSPAYVKAHRTWHTALCAA
jgi:hypothetical protein